jgi:hypothetical protein
MVMGQPGRPRHQSAATAWPYWGGWEQVQADEWRRQQAAWESELYARRVRAAVASRLELVNVRHAEHAWQLRHQFGIAPTSLALLYLDHPPDGRGLSIAVAGKLFARSEQTGDTGRLLYDLCRAARDVMAAGADPRVELCERPDEMSEHAILIGVAVSIVDDDGGPGGGANSRGRVLGLLVDDTMLLAQRWERHHPEHFFVDANTVLDAWFSRLGRRWRHNPQLSDLVDPLSRPIWLRLAELCTILTDASGGADGHG